MSEVLVDLPRRISWRASEGAPEVAYGPGRALIPQALAEQLKADGVITWLEEGAEAPKWSDVDRLIPSAELAPDFPAREYLFLAGIYTYKNVAELTPDQVASLRGVGEARAKQILEAQAVVREKLPKRIDPEELHVKVFVIEEVHLDGSSMIDPADVPAEEAEADDGAQPDAG